VNFSVSTFFCFPPSFLPLQCKCDGGGKAYLDRSSAAKLRKKGGRARGWERGGRKLSVELSVSLPSLRWGVRRRDTERYRRLSSCLRCFQRARKRRDGPPPPPPAFFVFLTNFSLSTARRGLLLAAVGLTVRPCPLRGGRWPLRGRIARSLRSQHLASLGNASFSRPLRGAFLAQGGSRKADLEAEPKNSQNGRREGVEFAAQRYAPILVGKKEEEKGRSR
jgi:hypothetical protein